MANSQYAESPLAPAPRYPEVVGTEYGRSFSPATPGLQGPTRFEEGLATDPDVPADFVTGIQNGFAAAPGRPNRNLPVWIKPAEETMKERAHAGSASWVEAPTFLGEFAQGAFSEYSEPTFQEVIRDGGHQDRRSPVVVRD